MSMKYQLTQAGIEPATFRNVGTEYFKLALYSPFFSLQSAICFIMLTCLVPVLFTFYIQGVMKLKNNTSGAKGLMITCLPNTLFTLLF